jgi:dCTP diphosphatase
MKDLKSLQKRIEKFVSQRDWEQFHSLKNLSMSLSVEAAELMEHFQWVNEDDCDPKTLEKNEYQEIKEEIADVMIYSLMLSSEMDLDPLDAIEEKIKKNEEKYPIQKAKGSAKKYTEFKEEQ